MADLKMPLRNAIAAMFRFSEDYEQTPEEAEQELRAGGVDVDGFQTRLENRLAAQADSERLSLLQTGRTKIRIADGATRRERYSGLNRGGLIAEFKERQTSAERPQALFHKLDALTDDDLRTLLADLDELDEHNNKKPA